MTAACTQRSPARAVLTCGTVLEFESPTFAPALRETVPCLRHGYCEVVSRSRGERGSRSRAGTRRVWRTTADLFAHLGEHPDATTDDLRRHGFSLRLIREALVSETGADSP